MLLRQVTGPTVQPVTLAEAKDLAVIDHNFDDTMVNAMIAAASRAVGEMAGRTLTAETWALSVCSGIVCDLHLPKSPVQTLDSITYFDADDVEQTVPVTDFYLFKDDDRAFVRPKSGVAWPIANTLRADAISVTFTAGYTTCPPNLKHAVKMMIAHLYDNRQAVTEDGANEIPMGVRDFIALDRIGWVTS